LQPNVPLLPIEDVRYPVSFPGDDLAARPLDDLVALALSGRPEVAENQALVQAALERARTARWRPWLPNLVFNFAWGDFGGGPDLNPPIITPPAKKGDAPKITAVPGFGPSGSILHMNNRTDWDATVVWRLQNLGFGNIAEVRENQALARQASLRQLQ